MNTILESQIADLLDRYEFNSFMQAFATACEMQMQEKRCQRSRDLWKCRCEAILDFMESRVMRVIEDEGNARLAAVKLKAVNKK